MTCAPSYALAPCNSGALPYASVYAAANVSAAELAWLPRYGELTMVPSVLAAPAVDWNSGVPAGAPSADTTVMPSAQACLTISPVWASSAPMNSTCGPADRMEVSSGVMLVWPDGTTFAATGVIPRPWSALVNDFSSPEP